MTEIDDSHRQGSSTPKVSILLPNLNTRPFLEERMQTILAQTLTDWELIIMDSYSDDGAWEYFQECARSDTRIHIHQVLREGVYAGLNRCIELARGKYIYIATSDDSMAPDCLEKMSVALDSHPDCGLAICCLRTIDEKGNEIEDGRENYGGNLVLGERLKTMHVRYPPYDTIINCALDTTYISLTQLLIRKTTIDRIGLFCTEFGSWGDYEWNIRGSLLTPRVHIPEFLATWRRSPGQATQDIMLSTSTWHRQAVKMIRYAYQAAREKDLNSVALVSSSELLLPEMQEVVKGTLKGCTSFQLKIFKLLTLFLEFPYATLTYLAYRTIARNAVCGLGLQQAHKLLKKSGLMDLQ
jgi:glycosyltransferase involved in cell wall biosynthesis